MAVYSKRQLEEQKIMISVVKALSALTVLRLNHTYKTLKDTQDLLARINESIARVFDIYPITDALAIAKQRKKIIAKKGLIEKPLFLFVSANKDLYGDLIVQISKEFIKDLKAGGNDGLVVGKIGKLLVERAKLTNRISFFDLDDDKPDLRVLQQILAIMEKYDKAVIYHGKSESLLRQVPTHSEVERNIPNLIKPAKKYFFEPDVTQVLDFLQTQVSINSFHQKFYEAQLARLSARRWSWTKQQLARSRLLSQLTLEYSKFKKSATLKQQQVTLSAQRISEGEVIKIV